MQRGRKPRSSTVRIVPETVDHESIVTRSGCSDLESSKKWGEPRGRETEVCAFELTSRAPTRNGLSLSFGAFGESDEAASDRSHVTGPDPVSSRERPDV